MEPLAVLAAVLAQCAAALALEDPDIAPAVSEGRTQHRAGMIFPLLLAISRRLAALIPTALMSLMAIAAMLVFAKKAFLMSAAALAVAMYDSYRARRKHQKESYHEVIEPTEFTEIHFKPAPYTHSPPKSYGSFSKSAYSYKRPSSYDVPLHAGTASYYRQPVGGYSKPYDAYTSPSQALNVAGSSVDEASNSGGSYEVVDDYRPLGGGPAFVADGSEQQETFSPFYPNHLHQQTNNKPSTQTEEHNHDLQPTPAASALSPVAARPEGSQNPQFAFNHRPVAGPLVGPRPVRYQRPQYYHPHNPQSQRSGNREGRVMGRAESGKRGNPAGHSDQPPQPVKTLRKRR